MEQLEERTLLSTFTVDSLRDSPGTGTGYGSSGNLRWCVNQANVTPGSTIEVLDAANLAGGTVITLKFGELKITSDVTIQGPREGTLEINGNKSDRVFEIAGMVNVTFSHLNIDWGDATKSAGSHDGGGILNNGGTLLLDHCDLQDDKADHGGGIYNAGTLTAVQGIFQLNTAVSDGGGIYNASGSKAELTKKSLVGLNEADFGAGIYNLGFVNITGSYVDQNTSQHDGGGIYSYTGRILISLSSEVNSNSSTSGNGGGIWSRGVLQVFDSHIVGNHAYAGSGGGIYSNPLGMVLLQNSLNLDTNTAAKNGGAIFNAGLLHIYGTVADPVSFSGNTATNGGGIFNVGAQSVFAYYVKAVGNQASDSGGFLFNQSGAVIYELSNLSSTSNTAKNDGGSIANLGALTVAASSFNSNTAGNSGGGIYNSNTLTLTTSTFMTNHATAKEGGGVYNAAAAVLGAASDYFCNNTAGTNGGGLANRGVASIAGSPFITNTASAMGGGLYNGEVGTLSLASSLVTGNTAGTNGGGLANLGVASIAASPFITNTASAWGGGLYNEAGGSLTLVSSTVTGNTAALGGGLGNKGAATVVADTIVANAAGTGGGIFDTGGLFIGGSTIAGNTPNDVVYA